MKRKYSKNVLVSTFLYDGSQIFVIRGVAEIRRLGETETFKILFTEFWYASYSRLNLQSKNNQVKTK